MKRYTSREERARIEENFEHFVKKAAPWCVLNARKSVARYEKRHSSISLEELDEDDIEELVAWKDRGNFDEIIDRIDEDDLEPELTNELLIEAMNTLTEGERQAVILRVVKELDYDEISEIMNITPEWARVLKCSGIKKAKRRADAYGKDKQSEL